MTLTDVNDNSPLFLANSYSGMVGEDAEISDRVLQVQATDLDQGVNREISYSIIRGDPDHR